MIIDERVSVVLFSNHVKGTTGPAVLYWRGRRYPISTIGLHHTLRDGRTLMHIYSVTDGTTAFKLKLDTESLGWKLLEIEENS